MSKPINLGKKGPTTLNDILSTGGDQTAYPSLHIDDASDDLMAMPDKGEATIRYHVKDRHEADNGNGKKSKSIRMHVTHITPPEKSKKRNGYGDDARKAASDYFKDK